MHTDRPIPSSELDEDLDSPIPYTLTPDPDLPIPYRVAEPLPRGAVPLTRPEVVLLERRRARTPGPVRLLAPLGFLPGVRKVASR